MRFLRDLDPNGERGIVGFSDIAYNRSDGNLYGLFYSAANEQRLPYLATIDLYSGELNVLGEMPIDANNLAIDGDGNFYSSIFANSEIPDVNLHRYTADVTTTGRTTPVGELKGMFDGNMEFFGTSAINSMAWDHKADKLYWGCTDGSFNRTALLEVDPSSGAVTLLHEYYFMVCGLYIAYEPEHDLFPSVIKVDTVMVPAQESTLVGNTVQLSSQIAPWNASDWSVTWSSSNAGIATVDENGLVTGVSAGTAVITATSRLDPSKSASCTVTIATLDRELTGLVRDEDGQVHWASFNTDDPADYKNLSTITPNLPVRTTMMADGTLYASTLNTSGLSDLYTVDPKTFAMTRIGSTLSSSYLDMAYAPHNPGYGLGVCGKSIVLINLYSGEETGFMNWGMELPSDLVGITYYDSEYNADFGGHVDYFLLLDADGNTYLVPFLIDDYGIDYLYGPYECYLQSIGNPGDDASFQDFYFDGTYIYWTILHASGEVELIVWDVENTGRIYTLGCFPEGIRLVSGLYADADFAGTHSLLDDKPVIDSAAPAKGSLNAAVIPDSSAAVGSTEGQDLAIVDITMPQDATNGIFTVAYDAQKLSCLTAASPADAAAHVIDNGSGTVTVAFADRSAIPAGNRVACLTFARLTNVGETTEITIITTELNDRSVELKENISIALTHNCPSAHFVDVDPEEWYHEAVDYVVSAGYMNGTDATHFAPTKTMNRAQFVTVLYRMEGEPAVSNTGVFTDIPAGEYYTNAVYWALETGITTGTGDGTTFTPSGQLNRTALVTFMYRYARYKGYDTTTGSLSAYRDADQILPYAVDAWSWAVKHKIINGTSSDTLSPINLSNRAQASAIFQRFDLALAD